MTVKADYRIAIQHRGGVAVIRFPGLTDAEYKLLLAMESKVNGTVGYPVMKVHPVKGAIK